MPPTAPMVEHSDVIAVLLGLVLAGVSFRASAGLLVYRDGIGPLTVEHGIVTALFGAIAWDVVSRVPLVGGILAAVVWVAVLRYRYQGGWLRATAHGLAAWATATVLIAAGDLLGVGGIQAVGIPGT